MKKNLFSFGLMIVAALSLTTNCVKNEIDNSKEPVKEKTSFELFASPADTKTTTTDGVTINWVGETDALNVFHAETGETSDFGTNDEFSISSEDATAGRFTGTLTEALEEGNSYDWYVLYPYSSYIKTPKNPNKGYLPIGSSGKSVAQVQNGNSSKAHLAGQYYPLYGKATNVAAETTPSIDLYQALAVVKVHVTNANDNDLTVSSVKFTATENIVGTYYIDFAGEAPVFTKSNDDYVSNEANLTVSNGAKIAKNGTADFYIAIKPFTAAAASKLKVEVNGYEKTVTIGASAVSFNRGKIKTINFSYDNTSSIVEPTSKTGWYRVEDKSWLSSGDHVVIVDEDGEYVMKNEQKSNNRDGVTITVEDDGVYKKITEFNDAAQLFILEEGSSDGTIAFWCDNGDNPNKYIYAASSNSNWLRSQNDIDDNASFIPALTNGIGTLTATGTNTRKVMQLNGTLFSCYSSASYKNISIYKYYGEWPSSTTCATPTITQEQNSVTISCSTPGATIYYTIDGSTPDPTDETQKYNGEFSITSSITVKAIAVRRNYSNSAPASRVCTLTVLTPTISCTGTSFSISCATEGATIHYETSTTNMASVAEPTSSSSIFTLAVPITQTTYVKAIAIKDGYADSAVTSLECVYSSGTNTYSCTFTAADWSTNLASDFTWTSVKAAGGFSNNGIQVTTNASYNGANANTNKTFSSVSQVIVTYNTNKSAGAGTLEVKIGSNDAHIENWAYGGSGDGRTANYTCTFDISPSESGVINLKANTTVNSIYIVSVTVKAISMSDPN